MEEDGERKMMVQGLAALSATAAIQARSLLVYTHALGARLFGLGGIHALLDIRCEAIESLLDVDVVLCGDFKEGDAKLISQLLSLLGGDGSLLLPIAFVSNEDLVYSFTGMLLDVGKPGTDVF